MNEVKECCGNCKFFLKNPIGRDICRRYPAIYVDQWGFPSAKPDWWCGEWKPIKTIDSTSYVPDKEEPKSNKEVKWWGDKL